MKPTNIKRAKDHVFNDKHLLDQYASLGEEPEYARFDPSLEQALAWKRLQRGDFTENDKTWVKHEFAEHCHESKHDAGYAESHERAERLFKGYPWDNNY